MSPHTIARNQPLRPHHSSGVMMRMANLVATSTYRKGCVASLPCAAQGPQTCSKRYADEPKAVGDRPRNGRLVLRLLQAEVA